MLAVDDNVRDEYHFKFDNNLAVDDMDFVHRSSFTSWFSRVIYLPIERWQEKLDCDMEVFLRTFPLNISRRRETRHAPNIQFAWWPLEDTCQLKCWLCALFHGLHINQNPKYTHPRPETRVSIPIFTESIPELSLTTFQFYVVKYHTVPHMAAQWEMPLPDPSLVILVNFAKELGVCLGFSGSNPDRLGLGLSAKCRFTR